MRTKTPHNCPVQQAHPERPWVDKKLCEAVRHWLKRVALTRMAWAHFKKTTLAALLQVPLVFVLFGCGGGDPVSVDAVANGTTITRNQSFIVGTQSASFDLASLVTGATISNVTGLPTGVTFDSKTQIITATSATTGNVKGNPYTIKGTATKTDGSKVEIILLADINNPPTLTSPFTSVAAVENAVVSIDVLSHFGDLNSDAIQIVDAKSSQGSVMIAGKSIEFTGTKGFTWDATVDVTVDDGRGGLTKQVIIINVVTAAADAPTTVSLYTGDISTSAAYIVCNIVDLDGATGTCTLSGGQGASSWTINTGKEVAGLAANTAYTVTLAGTKNVRLPNGTLAAQAVNNSISFRTAAVGSTDITAPSLTSSATLGSANIWVSAGHTVTFDESVATFSVGTLPTGMTVTPSGSGTSRTLTIATTASFTAFGSVTIPLTVADATGNSRVVNVTKTINDVAPVSGGAFASLADMTVSDNYWWSPITISAWWVTDTLGRTITYSATGLPPWGWYFSGLTINSTTGEITGTYDAWGTETFTITVRASNGTSYIEKTFVLTINDIG